MKIHQILIILALLMHTISNAGTINFSNFSSGLEVQSDGTPINGGFVAVGTSSDPNSYSSPQLLEDSFTQFGNSSTFGGASAFNLDGFFSGVASGDGGSSEFLGKRIFIIGGEGESISDSETLFLIDTGVNFAADSPIFAASVDLDTGTVLLGAQSGDPVISGASGAFQTQSFGAFSISDQNFSIIENSEEGTLIGTIGSSNSSSQTSYEFLQNYDSDNDGINAFIITGNKVIVNDPEDLDYEVESTINLPFKGTSSNGDSSDAVILISISDDRSEDSDGDGLDQETEEQTYGTSDLTADTDDDGFNDKIEVTLGTDPTSESSFPGMKEAIGYAGQFSSNSPSDSAWFYQAEVTHDSEGAAQSGSISDTKTTSVTLEIEGPTIAEFWWKVSSEEGHDYLSVSLDGTIKKQISGDTEWMIESVIIPKGTHSVTWAYSKDESESDGDDSGWIDELSILPLSGTYGNLSFLIDNLGADGATITRCAVSAEGTINIPESIEGIPVTKIADNAFESCTKITRVIVPQTILSVGNNAFEDCSELRLVGFEGRLPEIGTDAFIGAVNSFTVTNYGFLQEELLAEREVGRQEVLSSPEQFDLADASTNQETIIELQESNENLLATLDEKSNQIISFETTLSAKQSELDTLGQIIETQDIQLSENVAEISLLNDEVESLADSLQIKETQITSLQNTVVSKGNQIVSLKGDISNLNDSLDQKNSEILSLNEQVGSLSDSLTMKGNQIASLEESVATKMIQINSLDENISTLNTLLVEKNSQINSLDEQVTSLSDSLTIKGNQITSLEESVATKMIQINSLDENISTLNTLLVEKNSQINSLDEQVTSLSDSLAQASNQSNAIEALNETINNKDQEITDLNKLYEDKCTQVISLTDEIETLNETIIDKIIEIGKLCERPTVEEIQDGRSGSILLRPNPSNNTITIDLRVEESGDLIDWQPTERTLSGTLPLSGDKKFYRFSLTE
ncbi:MAG: leucine-rich repeat protein [Akkermansiaceae bacterium]|jgi:predicted  nucleic acid-binding Zn-ribbon protein|nr:leucine-rich repeat protein [Akkermansiaceae bacterium]